MDDFPEKRKLENNNENGEKRQATDDNRAISIMARSEEEILNNASPTTVSMPCPPEKVGPLIGKKGVVVQEIMRRSSCRIYVDQNFPDGHPRQIQLTGHPRDLAVGIALVVMVMEHGPSVISPSQVTARPESPHEVMSENADIDFLCPPSKVGALIGPKGSNVHEIFRRTGCRVQVLQDGVPEGIDRKVSFSGSPEQISDAKELVLTLINGGSLNESSSVQHNVTEPVPQPVPFGSKIQESDIDPEKVRLVIGAKGVTIGEIMKRSGCKIFINQNFPEGQQHKVVYTGTPQQIDVAKYLIDTVIMSGMASLYSVLNGNDSIVIQEMNLYQVQANRLDNEVVSDIQSRCGVKINVDFGSTSSEGTSRVSIIGKLENVHGAIKMIYQVSGSLPPDSPVSMSGDTSAGHFGGPPIAQSTGPILALGKDGTAGHLESAVTLGDGSMQQVAEIKNDVMGRVVGSRSANVSLIKMKSGANVQVLKSDNSKGTTRVVLTGSAQSVGLAAQMVQEVLVNGPAKLLKMNDAVQSKSSHMDSDYFSQQHYYGQGSSVTMYPAVAISTPQGNFGQYSSNRKGYN